MSELPLPHLETFAKSAELNSFTAAGKALGLSQAAVSQRIQALEQTVGVALFSRRGGRVFLSEAGARLYPIAQHIVALHQEARAAVAGKQPTLSGELSIAASSVPGEHLLPELLSVFGQKYPHVQVRATVADSKAVLDQVERGHVHFGLVGMKIDRPRLVFQPFACDELVLIVTPSHRWAKTKRISCKQLVGEPLILREAGSGARSCLEQSLAQGGRSLSDMRVALELGSNEAIKEAVSRDIGVAVLSLLAVQKELRARQLHAVRVTDLSLKRDMYVVRDRRRVLPMPAQLFLEVCKRGPDQRS